MIDKAMSVKRDKLGPPFGRLDDETMLSVARSLAAYFGLAGYAFPSGVRCQSISCERAMGFAIVTRREFNKQIRTGKGPARGGGAHYFVRYY
jgi:hypothetical protein